MELKIEYVDIEEIRPYSGNAKTHPAEQIEQIKSSIQQFGFNDPIAIWHDEVVEGHGRLIAATELGMDTVPIIRLDDLTEEQRRAYALVHNKLTMNSPFDVDLLNMELEELKDFDIDMSEFGFDEVVHDDEEVDETGAAGDGGFNYKEQYGVIVMCANESDQEQVYNRLVGEGYECKVVAT